MVENYLILSVPTNQSDLGASFEELEELESNFINVNEFFTTLKGKELKQALERVYPYF